ncbi:MAG: sigma-54-dependent Fis family transcriptional regulator [Magnetococcales bacterium]|nr:sigma-54-dependent Fis family transcriptional regulator [Magnetococcales bacterium]
MIHTVLIVDDEESIRTSLRGILEDEAYMVEEASSGEEALDKIAASSFSAILLDIWMEGIDGIETLRRIKQDESLLPVIMMSGHGTIDTAVNATKMGAYDFLEKPLSLDKVLLLLDRAIREFNLKRQNETLRSSLESSAIMVGETPPMVSLREQIQRVAPTSGWVLITGENGVGKEVAARRLHLLSQRAHLPFIAVSSAAIPEEMIENELFGHEAGLYGDQVSRPGRFEQADGGTLFFDEIGDMSLRTQVRLLRLLQEQRFSRVGGTRQIQVDVRVIAASKKDLEYEISQGRFREELYYRLNVIPLRVPPLRERREDIPLLIRHFLTAMRGAGAANPFTEEVVERLMSYRWPGNVRELKNLVERLLILSPGPQIRLIDLPEYIVPASRPVADPRWHFLFETETLREAREQFERAFLQFQLERHDGNISRTADVVGMERSALHRKLKGLGLG